MYTKLFDPSIFTQETNQRILRLESNLKIFSMQLPKDPAQSEKHFHTTLHTQKELAILTIEEGNTRAKLVNIQASLTPHIKILQKELAYADTMFKKDPKLSTLDSLVHLAAEKVIQIKSLDVAIENWDVALKIVMEVNKTFLAKYTISV